MFVYFSFIDPAKSRTDILTPTKCNYFSCQKNKSDVRAVYLSTFYASTITMLLKRSYRLVY